jgi:hypothetical protein
MESRTKQDRENIKRLVHAASDAFWDEHARLAEAGHRFTADMIVDAIGGAAFVLLMSYVREMEDRNPRAVFDMMTRLVEVIGELTAKTQFTGHVKTGNVNPVK